jgi:hypothetical protein
LKLQALTATALPLCARNEGASGSIISLSLCSHSQPPQPRERSSGPWLNRWGFPWLCGASPERGSSLRNDRNGGFAFSDKASAEAKARQDNSQSKCKLFHESRPFLDLPKTMCGCLWLFASLKQQDAQPCHSQERHYGDHVHHGDHVHRTAALIIRGTCADLVNEALTLRAYNLGCTAAHYKGFLKSGLRPQPIQSG